MERLMLTGATGFIGAALAQHLHKQGHFIKVAVRNSAKNLPLPIEQIFIGDLLPSTNWKSSLEEVDVVIHLAARAHILREKLPDPLVAFRETNTAATINLAQQAAAAGVRRFIFISSIGVNGNQTFNSPFSVASPPVPVEPYAISKREAEIGLQQIAAVTDMEIVIIRPPLVYGANAPGNFRQLIRAVASGIPLPLGDINNRRSFIALPNLVNLIGVCIDHASASNEVFLVCDGEDLSTSDLIRRIGKALGKPACLLPVPQALLERSLCLFGKKTVAQRLCGSLQVDMAYTCDKLSWTPPITVNTALQQTAQHWLNTER